MARKDYAVKQFNTQMNVYNSTATVIIHLISKPVCIGEL